MSLTSLIRRHDKPLRYIDPTASGGGVGTFESPWNTWADAVKEPNAAFLQKVGTTASLGAMTDLDLRSMDSITLGVYTAAGPEQKRGVGQAAIDGTGVTWSGGVVVDVRESSNHEVCDLVISSPTAGVPRAGAAISFSSSAVDQHGLSIDNCNLDGATKGLHCEWGTSRMDLTGVVTSGVDFAADINDTDLVAIADCDFEGSSIGLSIISALVPGSTGSISVIRTRAAGSFQAFVSGSSGGAGLVLDRCSIEGPSHITGVDAVIKACRFLRPAGASDDILDALNINSLEVYNCTFAQVGDSHLPLGFSLRGSSAIIKNCQFEVTSGGPVIETNPGAPRTVEYSNIGYTGGTLLDDKSFGSATLIDGGGHVVAPMEFRPDYSSANKAFIGAGIAVAGITTDYNGNPFLDPPAIGAFEIGELVRRLRGGPDVTDTGRIPRRPSRYDTPDWQEEWTEEDEEDLRQALKRLEKIEPASVQQPQSQPSPKPISPEHQAENLKPVVQAIEQERGITRPEAIALLTSGVESQLVAAHAGALISDEELLILLLTVM